MRDTPNNETVIVEYGFADSSGDDVLLLKNNWEDLAEGVVRALADYIGVAYTAPEGSSSYTVKSGDTLWSIARKYDLTVDELKMFNNLTSNSLSIGQVLLLPNQEPFQKEETVYIVQPGDSLWKIASQFQITVSDLQIANKLKTDVLQIGQRLIIPSTTNHDGDTVYVVKSGDSLYRIANFYGITVNDLMRYNHLNTTLLSIGQTLYIPKSNANQIYTVVKGDSLWSIASRFGTTVQTLQTINNLSSSNLSIGQKLLIPSTR